MTKILFVMETGLGHVTVYKNLKAVAERTPGIEARFETVTFDEPGLLGRIPRLRNDIVLRGGLQARQKVLRAIKADPPDVLFLHTQMVSVFLDDVMGRIPTAISLDSTPKQFLTLGPHYGFNPDPNTALERRRERWYRRAFASCTRLFPYTQWTTDSLVQDYGVDPAKIQIFAHGVDLEQWQPGPKPDAQPGDPLRLLFVGGDFTRKGGDLLLRWMRERAPEYCELDVVSGADVPPTPRVTVHSGLSSNDPTLRALFAGADLFVLPTRADCTPQVIMEAMASGLPVLTTEIAALPDMLGGTGVLIPPDDYEALAAALDRLDRDRPTLRTLGHAARARAEAVYNGPRNLGEELDALRGLAR